MEILLIQPPVEDFYQTCQRTEPIGLAYLAASLKENGFSAKILDCQAGSKKYAIELPSSLQYLKEFYIPGNLSPFKLFGHFYHFGRSFEEIENEIKKCGAHIFGISTMFSTYHGEALKVAGIIKKADKKNIVIMGGVHASSMPFELLKNPYVDYVIIGEGEESLPLLLEAIKNEKPSSISNIDGIGYKVDGQIKINPKVNWIDNLDLLPFPDREILHTESYKIGRTRSTKIFTSRGCPFPCTFCSVKIAMGCSLRTRSPQKIIDEIMYCRKELGIEAFDFEDDNLGYDQEVFEEVLDLITENVGERKLRLYAMNGIFPSVLSEPILKKMKRAGFENINLTFASKDETIRTKLGRIDKVKDFLNALNLAYKSNLKVTAYVFLGVPGQTIKGMIDDLLFLAEIPCLIGASIFYPVIGTPLFNEYSKKGLFDSSTDLLRLRSPAFPIETEEFSRKDIFTLFYLARLLNFSKLLENTDIKKIVSAINPEVNRPYLFSEKKLNEYEVGVFFLNLFFKKRKIFGIRFIKKSDKRFQYEIYRENCSEKVIDVFIAMIKEKRTLFPWILNSENS
ncbi:MAG: cobalamin B12-binding domain-containing protein [Candidatus Schekmanbacteria bacterium]|nr:cobalamin B12-binding domain-containing protein [Candidatus Schekmanbacteria bacterium]